MAEARGRYNFQDNKRFIKMARGSLNETIHWMLLAYARHLLTVEQVNTLKPALLLAQFGVSHIDV
ncbi:MAG: four helix bundle protein [Nostocaceae cyanobacterium]|nr:four helix bundle protein [Nostocaceae cyanobacterium]